MLGTPYRLRIRMRRYEFPDRGYEASQNSIAGLPWAARAEWSPPEILLVPGRDQQRPVPLLEVLGHPPGEVVPPVAGDALPLVRVRVLLARPPTGPRLEPVRQDG